MNIELIHVTPLDVVVQAIRKCYDSGDKSDSYIDDCGMYRLGAKDEALIKRIIDSGHESTLEHCQLTFDIDGFSRGVLQESSRHRVGVSPSIKSTRYTLKELKEESPFIDKNGHPCIELASKYLMFTGVDSIDESSVFALENVRKRLVEGHPNDRVKYCLPECYKTSGLYTFNIRSLRHLLSLRTSPRALWEFQELAWGLYKAIPNDYSFMFDDAVYNGRPSVNEINQAALEQIKDWLQRGYTIKASDVDTEVLIIKDGKMYSNITVIGEMF